MEITCGATASAPCVENSGSGSRDFTIWFSVPAVDDPSIDTDESMTPQIRPNIKAYSTATFPSSERRSFSVARFRIKFVMNRCIITFLADKMELVTN
jgi:uncharacterized protein YcbX